MQKKITKAIDSFYEISYYSITLIWSDGRVVERGGLENRYTARYRGFKSLSLRINAWKRGRAVLQRIANPSLP